MQQNPSQDTYSSYFNKKLPASLQQDFQSEADALWQQLEQELIEACHPNAPNFDALVALIPKLEVYLTVYGPSPKRREMLATVFLRFLFEEKTTSLNKIVILRLVLVTLGGTTPKDLRLNWRAIYDFLEEASTDPSVLLSAGMSSPKGKLIIELVQLIRKVRVLYTEDSVEEVLRLLRQKFNPSMTSGYKGSSLINLFFSTGNADDAKNKKLSQEYFEKNVIPELFAFWNGRRYQSESAYLAVLSRIAKRYPRIDWSPYYNQIFTFTFNTVKAEFQKDAPKHSRGREGALAQMNKSILYLIPDLLVRIMRPKTTQAGQQYWENLERIYRATLPFIHPENAGHWSGSLAQFYAELCKLYIKRANQEQRKARKNNKDAMEEETAFDDDRGKEDEEEGHLDEVDIGLIDEKEEEEKKEDEEEDSDDEPEDDLASEITDDQTKKESKADYLLDEACHAKMLEMTTYVLKNLVYSREGKVIDHVAKTCRRLVFFRPQEFGPVLFKMLYEFLGRSDLSHIGYIKILMLSAYPLFNRKIYKAGLAELPRLLDITLEHLTSHDMRKTAMLLELYEVIFSLVPVYHQEDLKDLHKQLHGSADASAVKSKLNANEDSDFWQLSEDLSDWTIKFFKKFVELLNNFERKEVPQNIRTTALVVSYRNLHSLIFQSSPRLVERYLDILKSYLDENLQKPPSQYLPDLIHPLNLRDANLTLSKLLPLFKNQVLGKASTPQTETNSKKSLYSLVQKSSVGAIFDQYELKISNKETLARILTTLKEVLSFASPALLQHREDIELIIFHSLLHEDHTVFDKAAQLLHTVLLSLLSVYPTNLGSLNPQDLTQEEFGNIYKKVGRLPRRSLELQWHEPTDKEIQYAQELYALFFERNLQDIETQHLQGVITQKPTLDNLASLMDDLHLKKAEVANREVLSRSLILVDYVFLGISQRASYADIANLSEEKKKFEARFRAEGFKHARERICNLGNRLVQYTFSNLYVKDPYIGKALVQLLGTMYGEEEQHDELQKIRKTLRQKKRAFELQGARGNMYENRYLLAIHVNIKLQERILSYSISLDYKPNALEMIYMLWLFMFHSNGETAKLGMKLFRRQTVQLRPALKNEIFENVTNYTIKFVNDRFNYLREHTKELEENKTIKFGNHEITFTNKDSYVDLLLKGSLYNLEYLLPYLTSHLENLFQFIQILLDVPKADDASFLLRFSRLINGIDLSPYAFADSEETEAEKPNLILNSNDLHKQFDQKIAQKTVPKTQFYDNKKLRAHVEAQMKKVIFALDHDEGTHWKYQVVAAFTGALLSKFLPAKSELLSQFVVSISNQLTSGHYYLRLFATSAFGSMIKLHTETFRKKTEIKRKPQDFQGRQVSLDDAFKYHFILKEDYDNNYLKDAYVGILDTYDEIQLDNVKETPRVELPKDVVEKLQGKEFLNNLITNLVADVPSLEEASAQKGAGGLAGLLGKLNFSFKSFIGEFFRQGSHRPNKNKVRSSKILVAQFSLAEASLLRSLLKYFDGPKVFANSIETIEELARDYNSREKQVIAAHYFYAVMRTFKFWDKTSAEQATKRLAEIYTNALDNLSAETHMIWEVAFANATANIDYRILQVFLSKLLQNPFDKKLANIQGRYLSVYNAALDRNGIFSSEIAERFLDILANFRPTETRQVEHIAGVLVSLLKSYSLNPVNYRKLKQENIVADLDKTIQAHPDEYIVENDYFLYKFNKKFEQILTNYAQWARETANPEENKIYFELLFILTRAFHSKKLPYSLYLYYEKAIIFILELNSDESLSLSLNAIQAHKESISSLSKLLYPREAIPRIMRTLEGCFKAKNPKVRESALKFYHYFYLNHVFLLENKTVDIVINGVLDENPDVKNEAFEVMIDIFRVYTEQEIKDTIERSRKLVDESKPKKNPDNITKGLYILMAAILSRPFEIEEWTDSTIEFLLANKKHSKSANEKFNKDFAVKFWDNHKGRANVNERALSYEVYSDLREIGNPSSYFA